MLSHDSASSSRPSVGVELASGRRCRTLPLPMVDLAGHASAVVAVVVYICSPGTRHICVINIFVHVGPGQYVSGSSLTFLDAQVTAVKHLCSHVLRHNNSLSLQYDTIDNGQFVYKCHIGLRANVTTICRAANNLL